METLDAAAAARFAAIALANIGIEYPHKLDHVIDDAGDLRAPRALHPAFHGSFDWHSCVHTHWLLARAFTERFLEFLPRVQFPVRHGVHANSAFALALTLDYARASDETVLTGVCTTKALDWYGGDRDAPVEFEPSGADFLSPTLMEAALMQRVLDREAFADWLAAFVPGFADAKPATLFEPVRVHDRHDPQHVHLDGLNLSRAWCLRAIAAALAPEDRRTAVARDAAELHWRAGREGLGSDDFVGAHWLASFATLALDG